MTAIAKLAFCVCLAAAAVVPMARAQEADPAGSEDRLMIVNGNTHEVIYDDGHDDLFCVTRVHIVGYSEYGRGIYRRTMRCR